MYEERNPQAKTSKSSQRNKGKYLKDKRSDLASCSNVKSKGKISKPDPLRAPSPIRQLSSPAPTTPKMPRAAAKLGIPADVAKTFLK